MRKVSKLPAGVKPENDLVIAHSETGHHHVATGDATRYTSDDPLLGYLVTKGPVQIEHQRPFDTHETLLLDGGDKPQVVWEIRRQREWAPEGWRQVMD